MGRSDWYWNRPDTLKNFSLKLKIFVAQKGMEFPLDAGVACVRLVFSTE